MGQRMMAKSIRSGHDEEEINRLKFIVTNHHKHHSPCDQVKAIGNSMCGVFHALSNKDESNTPQLIETNIDVTPKDIDEENEGEENEMIPHKINKNDKIENKNKIETKKPEIFNQNISQKQKEINNANKKGVKPDDKKPPKATASHTIIKGIDHIKDKVIGLVTS
ncbi:hypothetical protein O0L34_g17247 [Tuta absoluta]|nr:hypothetical protein O0L34_g17247 [Tuta absoluta]